MPLDKFVLTLVIAVAAAGATIWLAALAAAVWTAPAALVAAVPLLLVVLVAWRVLVERLRNRDDDRYDAMK